MATAQPAADGQAIFAGQHQIQHEQVEMLALPEFAHLFGVFGDEDVESCSDKYRRSRSRKRGSSSTTRILRVGVVF